MSITLAALVAVLTGVSAPRPDEQCATLERDAARQLQREGDRMRAAIAAGADVEAVEATAAPIDLAPVYRACWRDRVRPALVRAETDDQAFDAALSDFLGWRRATLLLGLETQFAAEEREGTALAQRGLRNAYQKARERCHRRRDVAAVRQLLGIARFATLVGMDDGFLTTLDADVRACTEGVWYHVTVRSRYQTAKHGDTWDVTYEGWLGKKPGAEPGELTGVGTFYGTIKGAVGEPDRASACHTRLQAYPVSGELALEGSAVSAGGTVFLVFNMSTEDWRYGGTGPGSAGKFVALVGVLPDSLLGRQTIVNADRLTLTGRTTTKRQERDDGAHECSGGRTYVKETTVREIR